MQTADAAQEPELTFVSVFIVCGDCCHSVALGVFEIDDYLQIPDLEKAPTCEACRSSNVALRPSFV
jgi:hypothetical protein